MLNCKSTHGSSGYAPGSYWDNGAIICGACGFRIKNPNPTGGRIVTEFIKYKGLLGLLGFGYEIQKNVHHYGFLGEKPNEL